MKDFEGKPLAAVDRPATLGFELGQGSSTTAQRKGLRMLTAMYLSIQRDVELPAKITRESQPI